MERDPAEDLRRIAFCLERALEPSYRVKAFRTAAAAVDALSRDELLERDRNGTLKEIKGIGDVTALVGADGVHEWPVGLVTLGGGSPAIAATGPAVTGQVDVAPVEFPLVTAAQRAGDLDVLGSPWPSAPPVRVPVVDGPSLDEVIRSRGSTRLLDPTRNVKPLRRVSRQP